MEFFDSKEEVMDIQLTPLGKKMLSMGQLNPHYYAFFDDDILYDAEYAGVRETQNESELRIKEKTPRMKARHVHSGVEQKVNLLNIYMPVVFGEVDIAEQLEVFKGSGEIIDMPTYTGIHQDQLQAKLESPYHHQRMMFQILAKTISQDSEYSLGLPLGNSSLQTDKFPSWSVEYHHGELSSSTPYYSEGKSANPSKGRESMTQMPQLNSQIIYEWYGTYKNADGTYTTNYIDDIEFYQNTGMLPIDYDGEYASYDDNSAYQLKPDYMLLEVQEKNTDFLRENFDIQIFLVEETYNSDEAVFKETLVPLAFHSPGDGQITDKHVEFFLNINTDEEIHTEVYCKSGTLKTRRKNSLVDQTFPLEGCPEKNPVRNIYESDLEDIEEPC